MNKEIESNGMKLRKLYRKWLGIYLALIVGMLGFRTVCGYAEVSYLGINLSDHKEPVELYADSLEIRDKEGVALLSGDVSVTQGEYLLRTSKLVIYYDKTHKASDMSQEELNVILSAGFDSMSIKKIEALGKVYIKNATRIATGDKGIFDGKSKMMILTGDNVVLTDGDNVATGCKLTANMKSGETFFEGCGTSKQQGRVSIIFKQSQKGGY